MRAKFATGELRLGLAVGVDGLLEHDLHGGELGHVVRNLLEQDRTETSVEAAETLLACDLEESGGETVGKSGLRHETDTRSLERAKCDVGEELGNGGSTEVDGHAVLDGGLVVHLRDEHLLEQLVATKLETALEEVSEHGGSETSEESTSTFLGDDLTEATDHALVVDGGLELDAGLDHIDGGNGTVGDGAVCERSKVKQIKVSIFRFESLAILVQLEVQACVPRVPLLDALRWNLCAFSSKSQ